MTVAKISTWLDICVVPCRVGRDAPLAKVVASFSWLATKCNRHIHVNRKMITSWTLRAADGHAQGLSILTEKWSISCAGFYTRVRSLAVLRICNVGNPYRWTTTLSLLQLQSWTTLGTRYGRHIQGHWVQLVACSLFLWKSMDHHTVKSWAIPRLHHLDSGAPQSSHVKRSIKCFVFRPIRVRQPFVMHSEAFG